MRILFPIALVLYIAASASAQNLSVFNLDASNFPTMKASFYAFDANGVQQNPSPNEITITEDGIQRTVTNVTCPPKKDPPPITLGIMVDTYSGISLAKEGAQNLINLLSIPPSEAGITMMDHGAFIVQDLTQKQSKLTTAIANLQPAPGVDLQTMFYAPNSGGVPFVSGKPNKKVLVLISDLHCPQYNLDKAKLFTDCAAQNISVYVVLLHTNDYSGYFKDITMNTGGMIFEEIHTSADLQKVMLDIGSRAQDIAPCEITWQSAYECSHNSERKAVAIWNGSPSQFSYTISAGKLIFLSFSPDPLSFGGRQAGTSYTLPVTVTAVNSAFTVSSITSSDPGFDINPKSFSLAAGASKTLTVTFTPSDSSYSWTEFTAQTDLCAQTFSVTGGYPGVKAKSGPLRLTVPNGGEIYPAGNDTLITWTGIPRTDSVKLDFSTDNGSSWSSITPFASGGRYLWHVPNRPSTKCLVRVTQYTGADASNVKTFGSDGQISGTYISSIALDDSGNIYVGGEYDIQTDFGDTLVTTPSEALFVAKYTANDSLLWFRLAPNTADVYGYGECKDLALDHQGNVYITGEFTHSIIFGGDTLMTKSTSGSYGYDFYLARYHSDGSLGWVKQFGEAQLQYPYYAAKSSGLCTDVSGNIYLTGYYSDTLTIGNIGLRGKPQQSNGFIAKYHADGSVEWANSFGGGNSQNQATAVALDSSGNVFVTGLFTAQASFGGIQPPYAGQSDVCIAKYNPNGSIAWVKTIEGPGVDEGNAIAITAAGEIVVTGKFSGTADFGGTTLTSVGDYDMFVAKYAQDGSFQWADHAGGYDPFQKVGWNFGTAVSIDRLGYINVTGIFTNVANFGPIKLTTKGMVEDIFVAKYKDDGTIVWAKRARGSGLCHPTDIISDPNGVIYTVGNVDSSGDFDSKFVKLPGQGATGYIWQIGGHKDLESDISDADFSIIAPTFSFAGTTIDMGQTETGKEKDSLVKATICNTGTAPLHVFGMDITGGDKTEFMIMSGAGDFTLALGECRDVMFTFMPMMTCKMSATVTLRTVIGNYPDTIKILGEGIAPMLSVMSDVIDFGQVKIGEYKDTTIIAAITNIGNLTLDFQSAFQLGPDKLQFTVQSGGAAFAILPTAYHKVTLRFAPHYIGRTSGRIAFPYNGASSPAILNVFGQGLGGLVSIKDDSGYAGDHKNIPILLEKVPASSVQSEATNFSARIAYDRSVLYPSSGIIQHGARFDTVNITGAIGASETLAVLPFVAMLGESTTSPMNIVDFTWLDGSGNPADFDVETQSGTFHMLGICPAGGQRLYDPDGQISIAHVKPNPANGIIHIDIQTTETGRTQLSLMNILGQKISSISDGELKPGSHSFDFNTKDLSAGSYFLLLQTPTVRRLERVEVEK
jgi:hypothetical protein